jgi:hypothetical protein
MSGRDRSDGLVGAENQWPPGMLLRYRRAYFGRDAIVAGLYASISGAST